MASSDFTIELDKINQRVKYKPSTSTIDDWQYLPIYDVAVQVVKNGIAGHVESQRAVDESLPFEIINYSATISISGIIKVGEVLTSTLTDDNGLPSDINYQWAANGLDIVGAASAIYTLQEGDVGKTITVKAVFTDNDMQEESVTSSASSIVEGLASMTDPYYEQVLMLFRMNGDAIDEKGVSVMNLIMEENVVDFVPSRFGLSANFNGAAYTGYMDTRAPLSTSQLSGQSFTIEFFAKLPASSTGNRTIMSFGSGSSGDASWSVRLNSSSLRFLYSGTGSGNSTRAGSVSVAEIDTVSNYVHYAISREELGLTHLYANGVLLASRDLPPTFHEANLNGLTIGRLNYNSFPYEFIGQVGEIRITRTVSRYNGENFTPPLEFPSE